MKRTCSSLLLAVFSALACLSQGTDSNYMNDMLFATKTPYERARQHFRYYLQHTHADDPDYHFTALEDEDLYPKQCTPRQLTITLRHGTRYPSKGDIKRVAKFLTKFKELDIIDEHSLLKEWVNDFTWENEKILAEAGVKENQEIAKRFVKVFPELFKEALTESNQFEFMASDTQRTKASAFGFADGIASEMNVEAKMITSNLQLRNDLLRFFESCSSYKYKIEDNEEAMIEFGLFKQGEELRAAAKEVSRRLSKSGDETIIDADDLRSIWVICGFETALRGEGENSNWCDILTIEETHVLEYAWDLKSFWRKAYGYTLNYEQACPLLTDILGNFHHVAQDEKAPSVSLYFGHAETILPLQALLGLFEDVDILTSSNFERNRIRKFRTSLTAAFAANLAFVMYDCEEGTQVEYEHWPEKLDPVMIQVLVNEHVVNFPFTSKSAVSISDFETRYYQYVFHCEFDKLCENEPKNEDAEHDEL